MDGGVKNSRIAFAGETHRSQAGEGSRGMQAPVPVSAPLLSGNEAKYLEECTATGWISCEGPFVEEFEERFSDRVGRKYGIAVSSGTAALQVAVDALRLGPGDEVILPTFTIISCAAAVVRAGARPVVVDCDPVTWNMDVSQIEDKITPRTKAIMVVHIYGLPVDLDPVLAIAERYGLQVIEDAAESIGQNYKDKPCGSFGTLSAFSFYPNKHVTMGEGGLLATDDVALAERCRALRNLCFQPGKRFVHEELGWNFRITNLQAAVGLAQLDHLEVHLLRKRHMGLRYGELLRDVSGITLAPARTSYAENLYWVFGIVLEDIVPFGAEEAIRRLADCSVGTRPFFWPMHKQPILRKLGFFGGVNCPVSERIARRGFYVPSSANLTDRQIERVAQVIREQLS